MAGPKVDIGRDLVAFVAKQATFTLADAAGESYPEEADAIRVIGASAGGTVPFNPREDKFATATAVPGIQLKRTAEGSMEGYVMPSGTRTAAPDIDEMLTASGWEKVDRTATSATVSGAGSSAASVDLNSVSGFAVGDAVIVETASGSGQYEMRRITVVNTGGVSITVQPPLTFTPATGANVKGAIGYKPSDARDNAEDSLCLWLANNNSADRVGSWTPGSFSVTMGGDDAAKFSISGTGKSHDRLFQTELAAQLVTSGSSVDITVNDGLASAGDLINTYWTFNDGATAAETVKLTAIVGTTWTVSRAQLGTSDPGTTWAAGTKLVPYRPTGTYAGNPLPATSGSVVVAPFGSTTATSLQCNNTSLDCGFGLGYREDVMGTSHKVAGYVQTTREVTATLSGWTLYEENMRPAMQAFQVEAVSGASSQQVSAAAVCGSYEGTMFGWVAPAIRVTDLSLDRGSEEVTLDISGRCEGTSSGEDEILLMFG